MKFKMTARSGEVFEAEFTLSEYGNKFEEWVKLNEKENKEKTDAFQKALETWCALIGAKP